MIRYQCLSSKAKWLIFLSVFDYRNFECGRFDSHFVTPCIGPLDGIGLVHSPSFQVLLLFRYACIGVIAPARTLGVLTQLAMSFAKVFRQLTIRTSGHELGPIRENDGVLFQSCLLHSPSL